MFKKHIYVTVHIVSPELTPTVSAHAVKDTESISELEVRGGVP